MTGDGRTHAEKVRHVGHLERLLVRLKQGPATALDLIQVAGVNYRARVTEARQAGWRIDCERTPTGNVYHLRGRVEPGQLPLF